MGMIKLLNTDVKGPKHLVNGLTIRPYHVSCSKNNRALLKGG